MVIGYTHGLVACRDCFAGTQQVMALGEWRLNNNPGYYGSSSPEILILGFSKGANQNKAEIDQHFDKVAFSGIRHRLQEVLETLGVMPTDRDIDSLMTAGESKFGIASLVRCSICKMKDGICKTSGDIIASSFTDSTMMKVIETCSTKYLRPLPGTVKLVILLGTSESYIKKTTELLKRLYPDFASVNHVSFTAGAALWVYAAHPSPANGHFDAWVSKGAEDRSGNKRMLAQQSVSMEYGANV